MSRVDDRDRDWTERHARSERVGRRLCIACRRLREEVPPNVAFHSLETNEQICSDCLEAHRRRTRDVHLDVWADSEMDEKTKGVVRQSFRYLRHRLADAGVVVDEKDVDALSLSVDLTPVDPAEVDATDQKAAIGDE